MIEMRWLTRTLQPAGYGVPEEKETVLQYREWPDSVTHDTIPPDWEPNWIDVPTCGRIGIF